MKSMLNELCFLFYSLIRLRTQIVVVPQTSLTPRALGETQLEAAITIYRLRSEVRLEDSMDLAHSGKLKFLKVCFNDLFFSPITI